MPEIQNFAQASSAPEQDLETKLYSRLEQKKAECEALISNSIHPKLKVEAARKLFALESSGIQLLEQEDAELLLKNFIQNFGSHKEVHIKFLCSLIDDDKRRTEIVQTYIKLLDSNSARNFNQAEAIERKAALIESLQGNPFATELLQEILLDANSFSELEAAAKAAKGIPELIPTLKQCYFQATTDELTFALLQSLSVTDEHDFLCDELNKIWRSAIPSELLPAFEGCTLVFPQLRELLRESPSQRETNVLIALLEKDPDAQEDYIELLRAVDESVRNGDEHLGELQLAPLFRALRGHTALVHILPELLLFSDRMTLGINEDIVEALSHFPEGRRALIEHYPEARRMQSESRILILRALRGHEDAIEFLVSELEHPSSLGKKFDESELEAMKSLTSSARGREKAAELFETCCSYEKRFFFALGSQSKDALPYLRELIIERRPAASLALRALEDVPDSSEEMKYLLQRMLTLECNPEIVSGIARVLKDCPDTTPTIFRRSLFLIGEENEVRKSQIRILQTFRGQKHLPSLLLEAGVK